MSYSKPSDEIQKVISSKKTEDEEVEEALIDKSAAEWMKEQLEKEITRIKFQGASCIPIPVKNTGTIKESSKIVNRVEFDTGFDFDKIKKIMVSDATPCPKKGGFSYVNVLLFTDKPLPLIFPYLFRINNRNRLTEWVFINAKFERSRHHVDSFQ